jgi:hypothetical protein
MQKHVFTVFVWAVALLGASRAEAADHASAPNLRPAFGNTIMSTYPDGRQAELWLAADGSYRAKGRRGDDSNGAWRVKSGRLCLRQQQPLPVPFSFCTSIPSRFDRSWTAHAVTGETIHVALVHGRVVGRTGPPRHA